MPIASTYYADTVLVHATCDSREYGPEQSLPLSAGGCDRRATAIGGFNRLIGAESFGECMRKGSKFCQAIRYSETTAG